MLLLINIVTQANNATELMKAPRIGKLPHQHLQEVLRSPIVMLNNINKIGIISLEYTKKKRTRSAHKTIIFNFG
mgnify:CR=1 FL=1